MFRIAKAVLLLAVCVVSAHAVTIEEFNLPNPHGVVTSLTRGPDGRMWFIEYDYTAFKAWLGRIDADGSNVVEYPLAYNAGPNTIAHIESDDSIWFTETSANKLGRSDVNGNILYYDLPMGVTGPVGIASGIGLKLVFTVTGANAIGTVNSDFSAVHMEFSPLPTGSANPLRVTTATTFLEYWFTEQGASKVARMTPTGNITEFPLPTAGTYPLGIAPGNTGRFWFCERTGKALGEIIDDGDLSTIIEHPLKGTGPFEIALGPDNHVWFTEVDSGQIGVVANINGPILEFDIPNAATNRHPAAIARGVGQTLWFGEFAGGRIGRISDLNQMDPLFAAGFER
jgi:virginiamycin B lyase